MQPDLRPDEEPTQRIVPTPAPSGALEGRWLEPGERLAERYRIQERLGAGGMGVVYRAFDERLGLCIALKVLRPDLAGSARLEERLRRELVLARQVSHRNAVRIHDIGQDGDLLFLTMDLVEGRSLRELLREEGPLSPGRAVDLVRQLALALEAAHQEGIVHRDLKPANVLVDRAGRAWITDFGVARSLREPGITRTGSVVGTLAYLSPEQARGGEVDGRSDLYSLGILLFEMLTGELPFPGGSLPESLAQRITGASRDVRTLRGDVPPWLAAIVRRLLQADSGQRFQSARALIEALDGRRRPVLLPLGRAAAVLAIPALLVAGWLGVERNHAAPPGSPRTAHAAPASLRHTVAVLPLANGTGRPDLDWLSRGLAEMLATDLSESPSLRVVDSGRVLQTVQDLGLSAGPVDAADLQRLGELLEADRLVSGRVWEAGGRLRVDLTLSGGPGSPPPATVRAEGTSQSQLFAMAGDLMRDLRRRLAVEPAAAVVVPASPEALRAYQQGVDLLLRRDELGAVKPLRRAVTADPAFTPAWIRLARALAGIGHQGEAEEAARRAVATPGARSGRIGDEARALEARLRGEPDKARRILDGLVARHPNDTEARLELAEACLDQGDLDAARATLKRAVAGSPGHPRAWFLLAKASILAGDSRRAVDEYLVRALVLQNRLGSAAGRAEVLNAFGIAYQDLGEPDRALESYEEAAAIRHRLGDDRGYAATLRNLAAVHLVQGEHGRAEARLDEALTVLQRLDNPEGMAELHGDLGLLEEERGRYSAALAHYRESLQLRRSLGWPLAVAESLRQVGWASYLLGRYDDAMVYWSQSLELARRSGDRAAAVFGRQDLGMLQIAQGDWDTALDSFLVALRESRELELQDATASSLGHMGRIALFQGRFRPALSSFGEALAVLQKLGDVRGQTEFALAEAETWMEAGDLDAARRRLDAAGRSLDEGDNLEQRSELLRLEAEWRERHGEPGRARQAAQEALSAAQKSGAVAALLQARLTRAHQRGDLSELRELSAEADRLGNRVLQLRAAEALAETALAEGRAAEADAAARSGLKTAEDCGSWARTWRLHQLLAESLERRNRSGEAAGHLTRAAAEAGRLRNGLAPEQRAAFEALPGIRQLLSSAQTRTAAL